MAQPVEPMDTDDISDFDNKENSVQHSNVLPHSTEKGYEELDVSELNMKLRYSFTPVSSPMSKSYTSNCLDNHSQESADLNNAAVHEGGNLSRSLNSTTTHNNTTKTTKTPLQSIPLDGTITLDNANVTVTITGTNDNDPNNSFPSSSSSLTDTPEPTTPVTEIPKPSGSPILRGLKSVLSMFRPSQSPIPPGERQTEEEVSSPPVVISPVGNEHVDSRPETLLASTPLTSNRKDGTKRSSPLKESLVFNDDLEKELAWNDETTILFSKEKIPIHKLFFQPPNPSTSENKAMENNNAPSEHSLDTSMEPMDISYNNSTINNHTMTYLQVHDTSKVNVKDVTIGHTEKDESIFLDCETTFSMDISQALDATKEQIETENLNTSLASHSVKQDETNMSMFSAEFHPEYEEIDVTKTDNIEAPKGVSLIKVENLNQTAQVSNDLAPLPENLLHIKPTYAPLDEIINVIPHHYQDHKSLQQRDEDDRLDTDEVPESIQKTLEDTLYRMDETQCFDDTVDVISRLEAAIRQQDDEFMEAPTNFEKEDFETTLANLVNNLSSKDATQNTDQSGDITVKDLEAVDTLEPDVGYIAENVPLPSESEDSQDENNVIITAKLNVTNSEGNAPPSVNTEINTDSSITEPTVEGIVIKAEVISNENTEIKSIASDINQTFETVPESVVSTIYKDEVSAMSSSYNNQSIECSAQIPQVIPKIESTTVTEPSQMDKLIPTLPTEIQTLKITDTFVAQNPNGNPQLESPDVRQVEIDNNLESKIVTKNIEFEQSPVEQIPVSKIEETNEQEQSNDVQMKENITLEQEELPITNSTTSPEPIQSIATLPEKPQQQEDQEIVISESNSPFVSLSTEDEDFSDAKKPDLEPIETDIVNELENQFVSKAKAGMSPLLSPRLPGKACYNFNFDEMDDPFALKSKVRMSPPPVGLNETTDASEKADVSLQNPENMILPNASSTVNLNRTIEEMPKENTTTCLDFTFPQVPLINEQPLNTTVDVTTLKTDLNDDFNNLNMSNRVDDDLKPESQIAKEISINVNDQTFNANDSETMKDDNVNVGKIADRMPPPSSPGLPGKGAYNFNFDDMDDPFDTGSKAIKVAPPNNFNKTIDAVGKPDISLTKTVTSVSDKSFDINNTVTLNKTMDETPKTDIPVSLDITQAFNETKSMRFDEDTLDKIEDDTDEIYQEAKDDASEKERESLDDFAMEEIKISAELNYALQEKNKGTSSSKQSTYASASTSSKEGLRQKSTENLNDISNMFATKCNMKQLSTKFSNEESSFATSGKVAASTVTPLNASEKQSLEAKIAIENANLEAKIASQEAELASDYKSMEDKLTCDFDDKDGSETNCSGSSKATDDKDVTIKEVLTEDEDTVEGPFIEAQLSDDAEKVTSDNVFSDPCKMDIDMNQFTDLLAQPNEENFEAEAGEMFIDADAFEFLMNQNKSNELDDNGKESLFLKFDPLFAKRVNSDGIIEALAKIQKRQSTPKKIKPAPRDLMSLNKSPIAGPSNAEICMDESIEDLNATVSQKPTMVVPPAINPVPTPRQKATTPTRANRLSMNFTSPAMAVIDRLLSMSANNSLVGQDTPAQVSREYTEADRALTQFRELLAEKEVSVHQQRCENKDLRDRLAALESQVSSLESEGEKRLRNIEDLNKKLDERDKMNKNMASVVEEYERTIAGLIAGIEEDKKLHAEERMLLIRERDEQTAHLSSMEVAFNDLHSKYEKSKQIIFSYKAKEDIYKKSIKEFEDNLIKMENNYESLKQHATSKLNFANQELEKINKSHESEVLKLNAMMKRKDLHISSLEETLAQKSKANEELTAICDELINKVG